MDTLKLNTGSVKIAIERDGEQSGFISFNPNDILFAEKFYKLLDELNKKQKEYEKRAKKLDEASDGNAENVSEVIDFLKEVCAYMRDQVDYLFGKGTSQIVFGDALSLDAFKQFFEGITPFIENARKNKINKYLNDRFAGRVMD